MGITVIFRALGSMLSLLGILMLLPMLLALSEGDGDAGAYLFGFVLTVFFGTTMFLAARDKRRGADLRGAILFVVLWWTVTPIFGALPFILNGLAPLDAYFDAVSALTTTGGWLSEDGARSSRPDMLWRALMQWLGGLASLAIAAVIFIRPAFVGTDTLLPPFSRGDSGSHIRAMKNALFVFSRVYLLLTVVAAGVLLLGETGTFEAVILALSGVASGGFIPYANGPAGLTNITSGMMLTLYFLSGVNFILLARIFFARESSLKDVETGVYALVVVLVTFLFFVSGEPNAFDLIPRYAFNAVSMVSTNGVFIGAPPPLLICLITILIGGTAISTAGGLKILRWLVVLRRSTEELRRLSSPNAVYGASNTQNELGVWMHFIVFTLVLGLLLVSLAAGGHSFELSATAAASVLSNAGPVIGLISEGESGFAIFSSSFSKTMLIVGMILGRVEAVAALALLNQAFWRT